LTRPAPGSQADPWDSLRKFTSARIALGRAGGSLPTAELLRFALDHAEARDAVNSELDFPRLERDLSPLGLPLVTLASEARDRQSYLQNPDLGRRLSADSLARLQNFCPAGEHDVSIVVADGLSAFAAQSHAAAVLASLVPRLVNKGHRLAPAALVRFGRVAIMDRIGAAMHSRVGLILIGERPGLGAADSLGAYLVFAPSIGKTDADRNCVSNIRPAGLPPSEAAATILYLIEQMLERQTSGFGLKDERKNVSQIRIDHPSSQQT
jgi:ethanolamine ammonia-lyase small subunit